MLAFLAARFLARTALAGGDAGFRVRTVVFVLAALRLGVVMLVLGVVGVGLATWSRTGDVAATQQTNEWQTRQQAEEPAAGASGDEGTGDAIEGAAFHATALLSVSSIAVTVDMF